jgi:hypothetical protein
MGKSHRDREYISGLRAWRKEEWEVIVNVYGFLLGMMKVPKLDSDNGCIVP